MITRRGGSTAILRPAENILRKLSHEEILGEFRKLRMRSKPGKTDARELINQGRRI